MDILQSFFLNDVDQSVKGGEMSARLLFIINEHIENNMSA